MKTELNLSYEQAYAELTRILQLLQDQEISLEDMTKHLQRAKELILYCREKLNLTAKELEQVFAEEE